LIQVGIRRREEKSCLPVAFVVWRRRLQAQFLAAADLDRCFPILSLGPGQGGSTGELNRRFGIGKWSLFNSMTIFDPPIFDPHFQL
jgi:hypothetical protein